MDSSMIVSVSPHIHAKESTQTIMRDVLIALAPAVIASDGCLYFCSLPWRRIWPRFRGATP